MSNTIEKKTLHFCVLVVLMPGVSDFSSGLGKKEISAPLLKVVTYVPGSFE